MATINNKQITDPNAVSVCNLKARYDGHEVLHGINFSVQPGEFLSIVGKSGTGKSTLLLALLGLISREGEVSIPENVGMVFQNYAVFPWFTVQGNIAFGLSKFGQKERERIVQQQLDMIGMQKEANKYPSQLSGGQTQRIAIARALATNPAVILMDEPFGALDVYTREKMQSWLLDIYSQHRKTVLFVTHSIEEAIYLSDRVLVLGWGEILCEFEVPFKRPRTESLKFETDFVLFKKKIIDAMEKS